VHHISVVNCSVFQSKDVMNRRFNRTVICIDFGLLDPDPDPGEQKGQKNLKSENILCFEVLDVLF
jgi:hypothetical protein